MPASQRKTALASVLGLVLIGSVIAQTGNRVHHVIVVPGDLKWVDHPTRPGQRSAVLYGSREQPGPYAVRVRFPPNTLNSPHAHPDDRMVTVLSGTWYLGQGDKPNRDKTTKVTPGTFFTEPAKEVHYEFTGPEEVIVQATGFGPTS